MRVTLVAIGRLKAGPERDLCARYQERFAALGRTFGLAPFRLVELSESPARRSEDRAVEEARGLLSQCPEDALVIAFDERGKSLGSIEFARRLEQARDAGTPDLVLLIGGADGLDSPARARADLILGFGAMTLPHQIVRVLVLEQLYRATTILSGHPYHRV